MRVRRGPLSRISQRIRLRSVVPPPTSTTIARRTSRVASAESLALFDVEVDVEVEAPADVERASQS
jgi:hypothetical protein